MHCNYQTIAVNNITHIQGHRKQHQVTRTYFSIYFQFVLHFFVHKENVFLVRHSLCSDSNKMPEKEDIKGRMEGQF